MKKILKTLFAFLTGFIIIITSVMPFETVSAATGGTYTIINGLDNVPDTYDYAVTDNLSYDNVNLISRGADGSTETSNQTWVWDYQYESDGTQYKYVKYNGTAVNKIVSGEVSNYDYNTNGDIALEGSLTLVWTDAVKDTFGRKYNLEMTLSNITCKYYSYESNGDFPSTPIVVRFRSGKVMFYSSIAFPVKFNVDFKVVGAESGKTIIFGMNDIDMQGRKAVSSETFANLWYGDSNIDTANYSNPSISEIQNYYQEGVQLLSGISENKVYISSDNISDLPDNNKDGVIDKNDINANTYGATSLIKGVMSQGGFYGSHNGNSGIEIYKNLSAAQVSLDYGQTAMWGYNSNNSWTSGMKFLGDASGFSFIWSGAQCGTEIFCTGVVKESYFNLDTVITSGEGKISVTDSSNNETLLNTTDSTARNLTISELQIVGASVRNISIVPNKGYYISYISVDGESLEISDEYSMSAQVEMFKDHTISVGFLPIIGMEKHDDSGNYLKYATFNIRENSLTTSDKTTSTWLSSNSIYLYKIKYSDGTFSASEVGTPKGYKTAESLLWYVKEGIIYTDSNYKTKKTITDYNGNKIFYYDFIDEKIKTTDITISKTVSGNMSSADEYFLFTVNIEGAEAGSTITVDVTDCDYKTKITGLNKTTYTNPTSIVVDSDGTAEVNFMLQSSQSITLKNVVCNSDEKIYVSETDYSKEGYVTSVSASTELNVSISGNTATIIPDKEGTVKIEYTNSKEGVIPTGIAKANMRVIMFLFAPFLAFALIKCLKKLRNCKYRAK